MRCACVRTFLLKGLVLAGLALAAGVLLSQLAACNTVKGIGRDVEAMAQGGQDFIDGKH